MTREKNVHQRKVDSDCNRKGTNIIYSNMKRVIIILTLFISIKAEAQVISPGPTASNEKNTTELSQAVPDTSAAKVITLSAAYGATAEPIGNKIEIKVEQKGTTVTASYENNETRSAAAEIKLINVNGETVKIIHQGKINAGKQQFTFDAKALASGMYYLITTIEGRQFAEKLLLK
jgi:flagellar hook assembly protein FlgD